MTQCVMAPALALLVALAGMPRLAAQSPAAPALPVPAVVTEPPPPAASMPGVIASPGLLPDAADGGASPFGAVHVMLGQQTGVRVQATVLDTGPGTWVAEGF